MRVVVVGGTGNISTGIIKALWSLGHEVTAFTRGQRESRLPDGVRHLTGDRKDRAAFEATMQGERFDAAIDMICYTAEDAASALRAFRGVKHLIHCSTVCTYGGPLPFVPANEETPLRPITDYGRNKVAADEIFLGQNDIPVTIFKPAHTFGPQWIVLRQFGFDNAWIDRLRKRKPVIVSGDGQNLWSWCHSDDAGVAFAAAVGRENCFGQVYNITRPDYLTWQEYHERVAAALNLPITIVHLPADVILASPLGKKAGLLASQAQWNQAYDVSQLQRDIPEFQPQVSLEDGVRECVAEMDRRGTMGNSDEDDTEDRVIAAQRRMLEDIRTR